MTLHDDGCELIRNMADPATVTQWIARVTAALADTSHTDSVLQGRRTLAYGARNLLDLVPECVDWLKTSGLQIRLIDELGPASGVVRGLYFDKPPGNSWALPWHRDETIAVAAHRSSTVFAQPTVKAGVPHVVAPREILETMLTVRIHLDAMDDKNGALRVVPGSHLGETSREPQIIVCGAGDVLFMRPLLLHASGHSIPNSTRHRRIAHLECATSRDLPDGFAWHRYLPLSPSREPA